ncbi:MULTISPECIES: hypothetical protein [Helicobacter]|uniref:hypothetical protein n=1 Tax=Helicobacter TaxID=209 RepID=UPI000EAE1DA8|nr:MULTISPECIES: hypothetical protein [Helicobacter]
MDWRLWCVGVLGLWAWGCMGFFPFFALSSLSSNNQDQLSDFTVSKQGDVTYYTRLEPPSFDDIPQTPAQPDIGLSSQDIQGTPIPNSVEIRRSDLLAEVQDTQAQEAKLPPPTQQSFHTLLNNCAKNDLFNQLGAGLKIKASEQAQCARLQQRYFATLEEHYSHLTHSHTTLLQDILGACHTRISKQAVLQSAFFKRLEPTLKGRKQRVLLKELTQAKPLSRQKLHALLQQPNLGERFYRCQYFIHAR